MNDKKDLVVLRAGAIVVKDDSILLTYSKYGNAEFYLIPGGGVEFEESLEECATREVEEETGLKVKIKKMLFVRDWIPENGKDHVVDVVFEAEQVGGKLKTGSDPDHNQQKIKDVKFIPINELEGLTVFPKCIPKIAKKLCVGEEVSTEYLGKCD